MYRPTRDERNLLIALGSVVFLAIGGYVTGAYVFGRMWAKAHSPEARAYFRERFERDREARPHVQSEITHEPDRDHREAQPQ
jgi:hypothetical protein